jgi:ubiquinone/menaquinone biosynthesis C-methylase UbiE
MTQLTDATRLSEQYATDENLRIRQRVHRQFSVGRDLEETVDAVLNLNAADALLDVGTGPGDFPGRVKSAGHNGRIVGLDQSAGMVARAKAAHPGVEFIVGDAMRLPLEDMRFDVVTARHMLYHVPDVAAAIREAQRVLKPGGRFLAITNADGFMQEFWDAVIEAVAPMPAFAAMVKAHRAPLYHHARLEETVRAVFGNAKPEPLDGALEFPDGAAPLSYFDSARTMYDVDMTSWEQGREAFRTVLEGLSFPWRVSKEIAFISAIRD